MSSLYNSHVKLLAFDFHSLTQPSPSNPTTFLRNQTPLSGVESVGIIVSIEHKPDNFLKFFVDDGTSVIPCILWLNHLTSAYFSRRNPADVRVNAALAAQSALGIRVGVVARGRTGVYRKGLQITAMDVVVERDPNAEMLHWLDCVRTSKKDAGAQLSKEDWKFKEPGLRPRHTPDCKTINKDVDAQLSKKHRFTMSFRKRQEEVVKILLENNGNNLNKISHHIFKQLV